MLELLVGCTGSLQPVKKANVVTSITFLRMKLITHSPIYSDSISRHLDQPRYKVSSSNTIVIQAETLEIAHKHTPV